MIISKLNGRVLSSENDQECVLWRKDGGYIRSVSRMDYVLGIYGGHREPGHPVVLSEIRKEDDMSQQFDERPAVSLHNVQSVTIQFVCAPCTWQFTLLEQWTMACNSYELAYCGGVSLDDNIPCDVFTCNVGSAPN